MCIRDSANIIALLKGDIKPGHYRSGAVHNEISGLQGAYSEQFKKHASAIDTSQLWQKRCYYALFATAVISLAMAMVYPAHIFLMLFYISAYSTVFFHVLTAYVVIRNPSINNLRIDANLYGQQGVHNLQSRIGNISFLSYKQVISTMPSHISDPLSAVRLEQDMLKMPHVKDVVLPHADAVDTTAYGR